MIWSNFLCSEKLYKIDQLKKEKEQKEVLKEINKVEQKSDQEKLVKLEIQRKAEIAERHKNEVRASSRIQDSSNKICNFSIKIFSKQQEELWENKKL